MEEGRKKKQVEPRAQWVGHLRLFLSKSSFRKAVTRFFIEKTKKSFLFNYSMTKEFLTFSLTTITFLSFFLKDDYLLKTCGNAKIIKSSDYQSTGFE